MDGETRQQERPTWQEYTASVEVSDLAAACAILDVAQHSPLRRDAARWLRYCESGGRAVNGVFMPDPLLDWEAWAAHVDKNGRGWSHGERRLYAVVASLAAGRPFAIPGVLDNLGEWAVPIWRILLAWASGMPASKIRACVDG